MKAKIYILLVLIALVSSSAYGLRNPSAVYCTTLGYNYVKSVDADGNEIGICEFPGNKGNASCDSWAFLAGKCGTQYSYCANKGYGQKPAVGAECGSEDLLAECLLCVLPDGKTAEVTSLMDLNVKEGVCGDGGCVLGETPENCPQDCTATTTTVKEVSTTQWETPSTYVVSTLPPQTTEPASTTTEAPVETTQPAESTTTLPPTTCGNGICEAGESDSCPADCPKQAPPTDYMPYIVLVLALLVILAVVKKKLDAKKIEKEREDFQRWKQDKGRAGL